MLEELAARVLAGRISAGELVRAAFERIERDNPRLNAVVALRPEARSEADELDERIRARGGSAVDLPLAGIPFLVKDVEDVAGMRTTHGSLLFADAPPAIADGGTVARLRAAGAIPVGKANTSEFAFEGVAENRLFGRTLNPLNPDWSPGGSSGGSAAAIAAGFVPIATATDAGGSVRGPAALCGLIGLKPTNGLIGRAAAPEWLDLVTDGILATSAADARLLLRVLAGPQPGDPTAAPQSDSPADRAMLPRRLLVAHRIQPGPALPSALDARFRDAVGRLARALALEPVDIDPATIFPGPHHPDDDSLILLGAETINWLGRDRVVSRRDDFDPFFARYLDDALAITLDEYLAARRRRFDHARALDRLLEDDAILVTPVASISGLLADSSVPPEEGSLTNGAANTNPHNVTGHPAIALPAGRTSAGIGFGVQVTAPRWRDATLLEVAAIWERASPWPLAAPGFAPFEASRTA